MASSATSNGNDTTDTDSSSMILYEIKTIPEKGLGLVATRDVIPGTLLLSEAPLLTTAVITTYDAEITESELQAELNKLPKSEQQRYKLLHNNFADSDPNHPLSGIVKSNAYPLGAEAEVGGVFPITSRINHSCLPNAVQYWNPLLEKQLIHAIRPIPAGDEILTSYIPGGTSVERKRILKEQFGFECSCSLCSLPAEKLQESDDRLQKAEELDSKVANSQLIRNNPKAILQAGRDLIALYEKENVKDGRVALVYFDLFQVCNMHGDLARARCFAKYYVDEKKKTQGKDSLNVLEMAAVVKDPRKHESYGEGEKWATQAKDVPKTLKPKEFKQWMYREI